MVAIQTLLGQVSLTGRLLAFAKGLDTESELLWLSLALVHV